MPDFAHRMTDEMLAKLEKQIEREYEEAARDMGRKYREYMKAFRDEEIMLKERVAAGEMSKADFKAWRVRHIAMGEQFTQMRDVLAADMEHANEIALGIARGQMPEVFALNANFAQYQIAHDFQLDAAWTLYDHKTAAYLLSEQRQLMPGPSTALQKKIAADKALKWNQKKIQSAVLQGVLQGEGSEGIAKRLQSVAQMNYNSAVRYARTMTTNAQNAGRYEGYHKARDMGIDLTIEWQAILDAHTRHTHRKMHGQRRDVDEPFEVDGIKILYPAQSSGPGSSTIPQSMIWNCRCTLLAWVKGFEGETVKHSPGMGEMSFEEWQQANAPKKVKVLPETKAAEEPKLTPEELEELLSNSQTIKDLRATKIKRLETKRYETIPTEEEIIKRVCGGDETKGSCMSLSFAYAGNKNGIEVLDFRGGESQEFFSSVYGWRETGKRLGVFEFGRTEVKSAEKVLEKAEAGKQYILIAGKHAAVVKRADEGFEYLELQDQIGGWYKIGANTLNTRFGCRKTARKSQWTGDVMEADSWLIDIDKLKGDSVFEEMLTYINTEPGKQKKGRYGYAK